jgi:ABC-type amino acid transport substrate-binding protein
LCLAVVAGLGLASAVPAEAQTQGSALNEITKRGVIKIGWGVVYPYMYRDPKDNQLTGFAVDFMNQLGEEMKVKVEWVEDSWATLIAGLQSGKYDVTLPGVAITIPRALAITYTKPVARQPLGLMMLKDEAAKYKSWRDLDKPEVRITTTLGSNVDMFATRRFEKAQIIRVKAGPESIAQVLGKKAEAWANSLEAFSRVQQEHPQLAVVGGDTFGASPIAMGVRQGDIVLRDFLNLYIDEQKRTGALKKLLDKHNLFEWSEQD